MDQEKPVLNADLVVGDNIGQLNGGDHSKPQMSAGNATSLDTRSVMNARIQMDDINLIRTSKNFRKDVLDKSAQ